MLDSGKLLLKCFSIGVYLLVFCVRSFLGGRTRKQGRLIKLYFKKAQQIDTFFVFSQLFQIFIDRCIYLSNLRKHLSILLNTRWRVLRSFNISYSRLQQQCDCDHTEFNLLPFQPGFACGHFLKVNVYGY